MSGREAARMLAQANRTYIVRVTNGVSERSDLLLATNSERRAKNTERRRRREGFSVKLETRLTPPA